jgi:hypothetical protein
MVYILLVYGAESCILRRVVKDAPEESLWTHVCEGESGLLVEDHSWCWHPGGFPDKDYLQALLDAERGLNTERGYTAPSSRCVALFPDWTVAHVVLGDPRIDTWCDLPIVQDDEALPGWLLTPHGFVAPSEDPLRLAA